jgi:hypothetical protein
MLVTLEGIVTLVSPEHPSNAEYSMLVTLEGIVTVVSPEQPKNAEAPILVTLEGIVMLVRPEQPLNAPFSILVTGLLLMVGGMTTAPEVPVTQPVMPIESP